ncbi:MAG: carboxypeptidase regulatory-like domain-containing protein, partial [Bacteroidota bacterium]
MSLFFIVFHHAQSQATSADAGVLVGKVMSETGRTLAGAKVFVTGASDSAMSDVDGKFSFRVPTGTRLVFIEAEGHELYQDTIVIEKDKDFYLNVVLQVVERMEAADVRVKRKPKENSVAQAIQTKRLSSQLVESISAEDFSKTTIRTTSDALKRIPGATISEGKFANVRGMFDRYNAGYLNGAPLPSTESDRKAFSFDVIPASLLDNIVVIKSATPDLIADFGGGIIKINTKSIPDKFTQSVSIGFQYNSITTGKPVRTFDIAGSEYFGVMSSANIAPNLDPKMVVDYNEPTFNATETKKFNNNWDFNAYSAKPSPRFNYTIGIPFKIKKMQAGAMVSWNYSMTQRMALGKVITRDFSDNRLQRSFTDSTLATNVQNGGVANFALKINNKNKIDFKNLYSLTYDVNSIVRAGVASYDDNITSQAFSNFSNLNSLYSSQLIGSHVMGKRQSTLNWVLNYGNTVRQVPDFRIAQYSVSEGDVSTRQLVINPFFRDGSGRFFSTLNENSSSASVDYSTLRKMGKLTWILKTGAYAQH